MQFISFLAEPEAETIASQLAGGFVPPTTGDGGLKVEAVQEETSDWPLAIAMALSALVIWKRMWRVQWTHRTT